MAGRIVGRLLEDLGLHGQIMLPDFHARVENPPFLDLVIESHDEGESGQRLYLTHYVEQNGDLLIDSELVFQVHEDGQINLVEVAARGPKGEFRAYDRSFALMMARNLKHQGFGKGRVVHPERQDGPSDQADQATMEGGDSWELEL